MSVVVSVHVHMYVVFMLFDVVSVTIFDVVSVTIFDVVSLVV